MNKKLKYGLIGLAVGYIGYIIVFYYYKYKVITFYKVGTTPADLSLIGSIPSLSWFLVYSLIFFAIGVIIGAIIQKLKK